LRTTKVPFKPSPELVGAAICRLFSMRAIGYSVASVDIVAANTMPLSRLAIPCAVLDDI
jgi:hypothetical protein